LGRRYFDDNAWIGLVAAQQAILTGEPVWWDRATESARFLLSGCRPDGGVLWVEGGASRNACSTGSAGLLFATIAAAHPHLDIATRENLAHRASGAAMFLRHRLRRSDGLIADHVGPDSKARHTREVERVEPSVWSYNQALALALFDRTGHSDWAEEVLDAMATRVTRDELHAQPAVFVTIWFRTLLARRARRHLPGSDNDDVRDYLSESWHMGRDAQGLLSRIARYDAGVVIDHAAVTGLMAAVSAPPSVQRSLL